MTQTAAVLSLLRDGPKTTGELIASPYGLGAEYRRTISDLRRQGYTITATRQRQGSWLYTLQAEPPRVDARGQLVFA